MDRSILWDRSALGLATSEKFLVIQARGSGKLGRDTPERQTAGRKRGEEARGAPYRLAPYLDRACLRPSTPDASRIPRTTL